MRKIKGDDPVIDKLINGKDKYIFGMIHVIREDEEAVIWTDDESCIIARSARYPGIWVFTNDKITETSKKEAAQAISELLDGGKKKIRICVQEKSKDILSLVNEFTGLEYSLRFTFNTYACFEKNEVAPKGEVTVPSRRSVKDLAEFIRQILKDTENFDISKKDARKAARREIKANKKIKNLFIFFLKDEKKFVSMLRINKSKKYALIDTVITKRKYRGEGYGLTLISLASAMMLDEGRTPVLYTDKEEGPNAFYLKAGYEKQGEFSEYRVSG